MTRDGARNVPCHAPPLAGRSLSVFLSLSIQAVAYLPVEYSSRARNGDRYGKEAEKYNELGCVSCSVFPSVFPIGPPKFSSQEDFIQKEHRIFFTPKILLKNQSDMP